MYSCSIGATDPVHPLHKNPELQNSGFFVMLRVITQKKERQNMVFKALDQDFSVCKIRDLCGVDFTRDFVFLSKTDEETSLVCESDCVPRDAVAVESGWKAFRIEGVLDFGLVGIIARITDVLAQADISVFVVSTYNTDYVFLKSHDFDKGLNLVKTSVEFL